MFGKVFWCLIARRRMRACFVESSGKGPDDGAGMGDVPEHGLVSSVPLSLTILRGLPRRSIRWQLHARHGARMKKWIFPPSRPFPFGLSRSGDQIGQGGAGDALAGLCGGAAAAVAR